MEFLTKILTCVQMRKCAGLACEGSCLCDQKRALDPLELDLQAVISYPTWVPEPNLGPLQEQNMTLIAEPFFQPLKKNFKNISIDFDQCSANLSLTDEILFNVYLLAF